MREDVEVYDSEHVWNMERTLSAKACILSHAICQRCTSLALLRLQKPDWRDTFLPNSVYTAQSIITGLKWFQINQGHPHETFEPAAFRSNAYVACYGSRLSLQNRRESKQHGMFMSTRWYREAKSNRLIREPQRAHRDSAAPSWLWVLPLV